MSDPGTHLKPPAPDPPERSERTPPAEKEDPAILLIKCRQVRSTTPVNHPGQTPDHRPGQTPDHRPGQTPTTGPSSPDYRAVSSHQTHANGQH